MPRRKKAKNVKVKKKASRSKKKERCMICKELLPRVDAGHLRTHGYTQARYERTMGARTPPPSDERADVSDRDALTSKIAERISEDKVWMATIADEVGERMLDGPLRHRLSILLTTMLAQRSEVHGRSLAMLNNALQELQQDWRAAQGGENGGPTDTETLLKMVERASRVVKESEEAVQRTMKLALEEQRAQAEFADSAGPTLYQGTGETLDMPAGLPAGDREAIRNLLGVIGKAANDHGTIDLAPSEPSPTPSPQGGSPALPEPKPDTGTLRDEPEQHDGEEQRDDEANPEGGTGSVSDPQQRHGAEPDPTDPTSLATKARARRKRRRSKRQADQ